MQNNSKLWWPICISETVTNDHPLGIHLGEVAFAIYRDHTNTVRAVEDRCPHRRAPLSLGRITPEGNIRCGYHGWTFNGETGEMAGFPNLEEGERLPRCRINSYRIKEHGGIVYLGLDDSTDTLVSASEQQTNAGGTVSHGSARYGLSQTETVAAFLDNPDLFLNIFGIEIVDKVLGDPSLQDGVLLTERAGRWNLFGESRAYWGPLRHRADFPIRLQMFTTPVTGESVLKVLSDSEELLAELTVCFTPSVRGTSSVHWRATTYNDAWGKLKPLIKLLTCLKRATAGLKARINYNDIASELPTASTTWRKLSAEDTQRIN